jgi:DNA-directed RNA polymerase beta subunit
MMTEADGETATLFPKSARLRNLTYSAPLYVDVSYRVVKKGHDCEEVTETAEYPKVFIGKVLWATISYMLIVSAVCIVRLSTFPPPAGSDHVAFQLLHTVSTI